MEIPQDIRSKIAQLDEIAGAIKEWFYDTDHSDESLLLQHNREIFRDSLEEIQDAITSIQEEEGWI